MADVVVVVLQVETLKVSSGVYTSLMLLLLLCSRYRL